MEALMPIHIYGLLNPETGKYFYVGFTRIMLKRRLNGHTNSTNKNERKTALIQDLKSRGVRPEIVLLETIFIETIIGTYKISERESFWVEKLLSDGHKLLNINYIERAVQNKPI